MQLGRFREHCDFGCLCFMLPVALPRLKLLEFETILFDWRSFAAGRFREHCGFGCLSLFHASGCSSETRKFEAHIV